MADHITTLSDNQLQIDPSTYSLQGSPELSIKEEKPDSLVLTDLNHWEAEIAKETLQANGIKGDADTLVLTEGLYDKYFFQPQQQDITLKNKEAENLLFKHFAALVKNKELIINNAYYYSLKPHFLTSVIVGGPSTLSLGALLEAWELKPTFEIHQDHYLMNIRGGLSTSTATLWAAKENRIIQTPSGIENKHELMKEIAELAARHPIKLDKQYLIIEDLIKQIA